MEAVALPRESVRPVNKIFERYRERDRNETCALNVTRRDSMTRCTWLKPCLMAVLVLLLVCGFSAWAQSQAAAPSAPAAAAPPPAAPAVDAPLPVSGPTADDQAAGDPSGTKTGTANDVVHADPAKPLTLVDLVNQAGQNRIAINFVWTLVTGFLVMFMQAGFAIVETGLCRAKNANHTMM